MARYIKLLIDKSVYDGFNGLVNTTELEAFSNGVNIALNKPVTVTSVYGPFSGSLLVDGDKSNTCWAGWSTGEGTGSNPMGSQYAIIDLQNNYVIEKIMVYFPKEYGHVPATDYRIAFSNDGLDYWLAATITNKPNIARVDTINEINNGFYSLYKTGSIVYGVNNGVFEQISTNWDLLTNEEQENLFKSTNYKNANVSDLANLNAFTVLKYQFSNTQTGAIVTAVPKDQLIMPKGLLNIESFEGIDKVSINSNVSSSSVITAMRFNESGIQDLGGNNWVNNGVTFVNEGKFGGKSAMFKSPNYLSLPVNDKFNLGLDNFTFSFWTKLNYMPVNTTGGTYGFSTVLSGGRFHRHQRFSVTYFQESLANIVYGSESSAAISSTTPFDDGNWNHIAFVRKNQIDMVFINGKKEAQLGDLSSTIISQYGKKELNMGGAGTFIGIDKPNTDNNTFINGELDDIFLVKGAAIWDSNFTPPIDYMSYKFPITKIIVTNDLINYKTYDFVNNIWQNIDHTNMVEVLAQGINVSDIQNITRNSWDIITSNKSGIGFAYLLKMEDSTDVCEVDKISLTVDMKGAWEKSIHGSDYKYGYPSNKTLRVKLLANGDYKVNYSEGEKKI